MKVIEHAGELWSSANPCTIVDRDTQRVWLFYLRGQPGRNTYTARPGTDDVSTFARTSDDNGVSWSEPIDACAIERLTRKTEGDDLDRLLWTGPKAPERSNLVARVSHDEGKTFSHERLIYSGPSA